MTTQLAVSGNAYIAAELAGSVLTLSAEFPADSGRHYGPHTSEFRFLDRNAAFCAFSALPAVGADYESFERLVRDVSVLHDRALEGIGQQRWRGSDGGAAIAGQRYKTCNMAWHR